MTGFVRVTVVAGDERAEIEVPAFVPLAEIVPDLARSVGLLHAALVHLGYRTHAANGRPLCGREGLALQGVTDGSVILVEPEVDDDRLSRYDEVLPPRRRRRLRPWAPRSR